VLINLPNSEDGMAARFRLACSSCLGFTEEVSDLWTSRQIGEGHRQRRDVNVRVAGAAFSTGLNNTGLRKFLMEAGLNPLSEVYVGQEFQSYKSIVHHNSEASFKRARIKLAKEVYGVGSWKRVKVKATGDIGWLFIIAVNCDGAGDKVSSVVKLSLLSSDEEHASQTKEICPHINVAKAGVFSLHHRYDRVCCCRACVRE